MKDWRQILLVTVGVGIIGGGGYVLIWGGGQNQLVRPVAETKKNERIALFSFPALQDRKYEAGRINLEKTLQESKEFTAYLFSYTSDGKKVTGQINIPNQRMPEGGFPVVLMVRGYVEREIYETGVGTRNVAAVFAKNGYVTLAPDFLGYGGSDKEDDNILVARFEKPVELVNLIASLESVKEINPDKLVMWGHSNGGQIALSVLEISRRKIPTTLWAPVSQPFPYSVLYFTEELDDKGAAIKRAVAEFEESYNPTLFSITAFLDQIEAPLQLHQGGKDEAVPQEWSDDLVNRLKMLDKEVVYYVYPAADHNLKQAWSVVVERDLAFFAAFLVSKPLGVLL